MATLHEADRVKTRLRRLRAAVRAAAANLEMQCAAEPMRYRTLFVTLTYARDDSWAPEQITEYMHRLRSWHSRRGAKLRCVWVAELTKRGRVHYHVMLWLPARLRLPASDRRGWWPYGMTQTQRARSPVGYLVKYASKGVGAGQSFPRRCRTHGHAGLTVLSRQRVRWETAGGWVRDAFKDLGMVFADVRRVVGGRMDAITGAFIRSPWHVWLPGNGRVFFWSDEELCHAS